MSRVVCKLIMFVFLVLGANSKAEDVDFSESVIRKNDSEMSLDRLRYGIEIQGDILVFNKTGTKLLYKIEEDRKWRFGNEKPITSYWRVSSQGMPEVALYHEWQYNQKGELGLKIKQFESLAQEKDGQVKTGKMIQEKEFIIENMSVPSIVLFQEADRRVVVQFKIQIWPEDNAEDIGKLAINSNRLTIYDNKGNLWASRVDNSSGNNIYFGVTTHQGSIYLSYLPFKGAKKIGSADRNRIKIEHNKLKLFIESGDFFLPRGVKANVYGIVDLNKRTDRLNSVRSNGSDKEARFIEAMGKTL